MSERKLTKVHLVGELGNRFGENWSLDVFSPAEAIRAININTRGKLEEYLLGEGREALYQIALEHPDNVIEPREGTHRSGHCDIWFIPVIAGQDKGVGKILAGVGLLALAFLAPAGAWGAFAMKTAAGGLTVLGSVTVGFGISLLLGGISQLLAPRPQSPAESPDQNPSKSFQGNSTAIVQGNCVPLVYGRALVPAVPISLSISNQPFNTTLAGNLGTVDTTELIGGGEQYESFQDDTGWWIG